MYSLDKTDKMDRMDFKHICQSSVESQAYAATGAFYFTSKQHPKDPCFHRKHWRVESEKGHDLFEMAPIYQLTENPPTTWNIANY